MALSTNLCIWTLTLISMTSHLTMGVSPSADLPGSQPGSGGQYNYPVGDPRRCQEKARESKFEMLRFEVLPGLGWDNLQNLGMGMVVSYNYSKCRVTDDGRFLLPDNVMALPIKTSYVETFAELIDSYFNTTSSTSNSINVHAGLSLSKFAASGSFSREHQSIKSKQIEDKSVTTRVQLRYLRYDARLQPDPELSTVFKNRLLSIASHLLLNNTALAAYEAELLVRDFGTHYLTSVVAGAGLEKLDFLKRDFVASSSMDKTDILAEASASFFGIFNMGASYKKSTKTDIHTKYTKQMTHSYVTTHGGPMLGANTSVDVWRAGVDVNLVPMDRSGDPLYFLVTEKMLPELPASTVANLEKVVRNTIEIYYDMNTIKGCTQQGSPNFRFSANFDDGTCKQKATNLTFGGVFQTCDLSGRYLTSNPCKGMQQVNPKTGLSKCPTNYEPVLLFAGYRKGAAESKKVCRRGGLFGWFTKCHMEQYQATAYYRAYWCAAEKHVPNNSGYLFGGSYTSRRENPQTGAHSCPKLFYALSILSDLKICLSDDFELTAGLPFGGFFTCQKGNPLAMPGKALQLATPDGVLHEPKPHSLAAFFDPRKGRNLMNGQNLESNWPKKCPEGYSQHALTVEQGCAVHYCIKSGALSAPNLPPVKIPPFSSVPPSLVQEVDSVVMFDQNAETWLRDEQAESKLKEMQALTNVNADHSEQSDADKGLSTSAAIGIGVGVTLVVIAVFCVTILALNARHRKQKQREPYHSLAGPERPVRDLVNQSDYGTTGDSGAALSSANV